MAADQGSRDRARRLLALLPFLRGQGSRPLADLASVTGTHADTVAEDLTTLSMCGTDEYDPSALISVYVDGDSAVVFGEMGALGEPVRLTAAEARALLTALDACGVESGSDLASRLASLAHDGVGAESLGRTVRASLASDGVTHALTVLESLAARGETAAFTYTSRGSAATARRVVRPLRCLLSRGCWYLLAWDEVAGAERTFRVDRMGSVEGTGEIFQHQDSTAPPGPGFDPAPDPGSLPRAEVTFARDGADLNARVWPGAGFERRDDGSVVASVPFAGTDWIARKVAARLGEAIVACPDEVRSAVADIASRYPDDPDGA